MNRPLSSLLATAMMAVAVAACTTTETTETAEPASAGTTEVAGIDVDTDMAHRCDGSGTQWPAKYVATADGFTFEMLARNGFWPRTSARLTAGSLTPGPWEATSSA